MSLQFTYTALLTVFVALIIVPENIDSLQLADVTPRRIVFMLPIRSPIYNPFCFKIYREFLHRIDIILYLPVFLIDGNTSDVTQCLKRFAESSLLPKIRAYTPDSFIIEVLCIRPMES